MLLNVVPTWVIFSRTWIQGHIFNVFHWFKLNTEGNTFQCIWIYIYIKSLCNVHDVMYV
jgi:hypothetical protein